MRRRLICGILLFFSLPGFGAGAQQVKLKANLQSPISHPLYGVSLARFKEEVEKGSEGALAIEIFDKGQLYRDEEVVDAVSSGAVDIGITASQQFASKVPAVGILDLPFLFNFAALMRAVARPESELRGLIDEAILSGVGVRVLWWQSLGDTVLYSKGRDVADPQRLRDLRVAVPGKTLEPFIAQCGGRPTALSVEKFHDAIKAGRLDMAMISLPALQSMGLWKVTDTITYTAHSPVEFLLVINERTWRSLSPDQRAAIAEAARRVEREARDRLLEIETRAYNFAGIKGMKVRELTPDEIAEWRACSADMLADYMDKNGEIAHRLMAAYATLRTDPCCTAGPGGGAFTRR